MRCLGRVHDVAAYAGRSMYSTAGVLASVRPDLTCGTVGCSDSLFSRLELLR